MFSISHVHLALHHQMMHKKPPHRNGSTTGHLEQNWAKFCIRLFFASVYLIRNSILIYNRWDVTCAGHCDDGPVESLGEGVEHGVGFVLLQGVAKTGKDQHTHAYRHTQQQKFPASIGSEFGSNLAKWSQTIRGSWETGRLVWVGLVI